MVATWTLPELVSEAAARLAQLPPPRNGQVRAVPDERTIRYYSTIGLLDRPHAMRGRTALYGPRHLAQVVAIKRMQGAGKTLAEIQAVWPTLDDGALARMTGVSLAAKARGARAAFWKQGAVPPSLLPTSPLPPSPVPLPAPTPKPPRAPAPSMPAMRAADTAPAASAALPRTSAGPVVGWVRPAAPSIALPIDDRGALAAGVEVRIELAPGVALSVAVADGISLDSTDVRALRASAATLVDELAKRGLVAHPERPEEEP
jgi:hypothetical protein